MAIQVEVCYSRRKDDNEMKEVDARGLSCPEPIMLTAEAIKGTTEPVKVLVEPMWRNSQKIKAERLR